MHGARRVLLVLSLLTPVSCMSLAPRSEPIGSSVLLMDGVPARKWADNRCAAGALSEVLAFLGHEVREEQLSHSLTAARHGGVTTVDLLLAARQRGFGAQLIRGNYELIRAELEQQQPLILMLRVMDAPGTKDDLFHYVVLSGIDRQRRLVAMHYGDGKKRWVSLDPLESSWAAGGHATFVIGAKEKSVATDDDFRRAVVLEEEGDVSQAISLYRHFLASHPESALAWTNLGNAQAKLRQHALAEVAYRNALFLETENCDAANNLAWLLYEQRRLDEAERFARQAVARDCRDRELILDTLAKIIEAKEPQ